MKLDMQVRSCDGYIHIVVEKDGVELIHQLGNFGSEPDTVKAQVYTALLECEEPRFGRYTFRSISYLVENLMQLFVMVQHCEYSEMSMKGYFFSDVFTRLKDYIANHGITPEQALEELCE